MLERKNEPYLHFFDREILELLGDESMLLDLVRNVFEDIFRDVFVGVNVKTRFSNSSPPHSVQVPTKGPSDVTLSQSARVLKRTG